MAARFGVSGGNRRTSNACFFVNRKPKEQITNQKKGSSKPGLSKFKSSDSHNIEEMNLPSIKKRLSQEQSKQQNTRLSRRFQGEKNKQPRQTSSSEHKNQQQIMHEFSMFGGRDRVGSLGKLQQHGNINPLRAQIKEYYQSKDSDDDHDAVISEKFHQSYRANQFDVPLILVSTLQESQPRVESARNPYLKKLGEYMKHAIQEKIALKIFSIGVQQQQHQLQLQLEKEIEEVKELFWKKLTQIAVEIYKKY
ncbi:UNKNOWN [Stylonychia lemnae]|uniref:Uncharacterized protein n=1 Tax=Stylonychia lemnae TaxID=5949 RepID=A0A078APQ2_STYLE|nr:UNKNOWN [Stylonychia lemnae]|eukprot:CDW83941.1 UNKNOWN [Stylonychia lemnae]